MKHSFINNEKNRILIVHENEIDEVEKQLKIKFPEELRSLLLEKGYGFLRLTKSNINRIMDPYSIRDVRLRLNDYENDPDLQGYEDYEDSRLIFFEANEGTYLTIGLTEIDNNHIFFFDVKVANSLEEFLRKMIINDGYYLDLIE